MKPSIGLIKFAIILGATLVAFQNCSSSDGEGNSSSAMSSQDGSLCVARGEWEDDNGGNHVVSMTGTSADEAIGNCDSTMSFEMSTSNITHGGGSVTSDCAASCQ